MGVLGLIIGVLCWIFPGSLHSSVKPIPVTIGRWISITPASSGLIWEVCLWKNNPLVFEPKGAIRIVPTQLNLSNAWSLDSQMILSSSEDTIFTFSVQGDPSSSFRCVYKFPGKAMVSFAGLYKNLAIPWQKRLYHQNRLDSLNPAQIKKTDLNQPLVGEQKTGAPYVWGGKQSLEEIIKKLRQHPPNQSWLSIRSQFSVSSQVNLDEGESAWDTPKGTEIPSQWCGLDCSGLVEQCARYAGLTYNWRQAPLIATGTSHGIDHFENLQPGDVLMVFKKGILVHFAILSYKGNSVQTSRIVHTVWFTNYRLHHNSILKTMETSLGELSNLYEYQFVRLNSL